MTATPLSSLNEIDFESDSMQVLSVSSQDDPAELPFTKGPIRFSVLGYRGKQSISWGVNVNTKGEAYLYPRDSHLSNEKVSFHVSGCRHISITSEFDEGTRLKKKYPQKWEDPEFDREAIATFTLFFPTWGTCPEDQDTWKKVKKDKLLIVGHKKKAIVVSFFIVNAGATMRGYRSHIRVGKLPLGKSKDLHIVVWKEAQDNLLHQVQEALAKLSGEFLQTGMVNGDYTLWLKGLRRTNSVYSVVVSAHYEQPYLRLQNIPR